MPNIVVIHKVETGLRRQKKYILVGPKVANWSVRGGGGGGYTCLRGLFKNSK